jgi:hypothetical protein
MHLQPRLYMEVSGQHHTLAALPPGKRSCCPSDKRLGGPQIGLDAVEKLKIFCPFRESKPASSFVQYPSQQLRPRYKYSRKTTHVRVTVNSCALSRYATLY